MSLKIINYNARVIPGVTFPSKSFVIENENQLVVISPCDFEEKEMAHLRSSTKNLIFIAPNNFHNLYLKKMKDLFPKASFFGPKRAQNQSGVELMDPKGLKIKDVHLFHINGNRTLKETCYYHVPSKTLLVTDLVFNMRQPMNLATKAMTTLSGTYHKLAISRAIKFSISDKTKFCESLKELLDLDIEKVIPAHGESIDAQEFKRLIGEYINS